MIAGGFNHKGTIMQIAYDKKLHLAAGFIVGFIGGFLVAFAAATNKVTHPWAILLPAALVGGVLGRVAGVLKEKYDAKHPETHTVDPLDIKFTMYGGVPGGFCGGVLGVLLFL